MHTKSFPSLALAFALCAAPLAPAQQQQRRNVVVRAQSDGEVPQAPTPPPPPPAPFAPFAPFDAHTFNFVSSEMSFDTRTTKGAPYTAEAVTEITQTLADGNRIVRRTASQVARDSEGRTRREAKVNLIGNVGSASNSTPTTVFINDPVAKVNYVLNEKDRTARKMPSFNFDFSGFENGKFQMELRKRIDESRKQVEKAREQVEEARKQIDNSNAAMLASDGRQQSRAVSVTDSNGERRVIVTETKNGETTVKEYQGKEADEVLARVKEERKLGAKIAKGVKFGIGDGIAHGIESVVSANVASAIASAGHPNVVIGGAPGDNIIFGRGHAKNTTTEQLGKQIIEGVEAEGTRATTTIPAGEIGNERPIIITSERWYSPELQTVVMTRRSDPRQGETIYRLTNINRSEPARSLFEVPSDYTIKESPTRHAFRVEKPKTN